ncbi:MAG: hypothetical protein NT166_11180 [Candidatus Aminicenantes bacterium]|nr:hypothetical protein [Candidatus Aminicenantes bacterium]
MNSFLKGLYDKSPDEKSQDENPLCKLAEGMERFWKYYSKKREENFAQQGYEDKGHGHSERIIDNVGELLENYCEILYRLNNGSSTNNPDWNEKDFKKQFIDHLEPNLVLFITAAFLHDIGMCFPGIFQALNEVLKGSGDSAAHINKIIHDYHNYATFIVLLEMNSLDTLNGKSPYLDIIPENFKEKDINKLVALKQYLADIYENYFSKYNNGSNGGISIKEEDFSIILGIICLLHQEVKPHYVQSILRKFTPDRKETVDGFNKWYAFFTRAREWTDLAPGWFPEEMKPGAVVSDKKEPPEKKYIGPELIPSKENENSERKLDLLLASALLQYGDKTEITIARLMKTNENDKKLTGLEKFWKDTQWDNEKGYICIDMAQQVISSYVRFRACRFIPLFLFTVKQNDRAEPAALDVMMHYFRFPKDKDVFPLIRYHNEKDFQDLKFLDVVKFHLPVLLSFFNFENKRIKKNPRLEINLKRKEYPFPPIDNELTEDMMKNIQKGITFLKEKLDSFGNKQLEDRFPYTPQNRKAIYEFSQSILKPGIKNKELFFKSSSLTIPSSFELMAILNLFQQEE